MVLYNVVYAMGILRNLSFVFALNGLVLGLALMIILLVYILIQFWMGVHSVDNLYKLDIIDPFLASHDNDLVSCSIICVLD